MSPLPNDLARTIVECARRKGAPSGKSPIAPRKKVNKPGKIAARPKETRRARKAFEPIPASELSDDQFEAAWLWHGFIVIGFVTLLIGLWKAGKSTLLAHLLSMFCRGGELAGEIVPANVLVVTEEGEGLWRQRCDALDISDNVHFLPRPFKGRPSMKRWTAFVKRIAEWVKSGAYDLIVFDTWQSMSPCKDENDAASTTSALTPLHHITEARGAVMLLHHPRKGDAGEGQASRGSGALPGFVDVIVELRRFQADNASDRRRKLKGLSRFDETPTEIVIELRDDGYVLVGTQSEATQQDRMKVVEGLLKDGKSKTAERVRSNWSDSSIPCPGIRTVRYDLEAGFREGRWSRTGKGTKGSPFAYSTNGSCKP